MDVIGGSVCNQRVVLIHQNLKNFSNFGESQQKQQEVYKLKFTYILILKTDFVSSFSFHSHSDLGNDYLLVLSKATG